MNKALYCYFGLLGNNSLNIPGHSFYQLPLLYSLSKWYNTKIDFYSYVPSNYKYSQSFIPYNHIDQEIFEKIIDKYNVSLKYVLKNIEKYDIIFLKARFRNLSTLAKKWYDTLKFEKILDKAIQKNVSVIILDTDLELNDEIYTELGECIQRVSRLHPDVFYLYSNIFKNQKERSDIVFYGNVYKSKNFKDPELIRFFNDIPTKYDNVYILGKSEIPFRNVKIIPRFKRKDIYDILAKNKIQINITKPKYSKEKFIPARIFESLLFYSIPISYNFDWFNKSLSFKSHLEFDEIYKFVYNLDKIKYNELWENLVEKCSKGGLVWVIGIWRLSHL